MQGDLREGAELGMTVAVPGLKPQDAVGQVHTVTPGECFEYGLSNLGGMLKAFRFIDIESIAADRCRVDNGETMSGPVGWVLARIVGPRVGQGLLAMNAKLKHLAEEERIRQQQG